MKKTGFAAILLLLVLFFSCDKYDLLRDNPNDPKSEKYNPLPVLSTDEITNITGNSVTSGGHIIKSGSGAITERGVCWAIKPVPTVTDNKTIDGGGIGSFVSQVSNLLPGTVYYLRAYAINDSGIAYGNEISFTTTCTPAICITNLPTEVMTGSAILNATVNANGTAAAVSFDYGTSTAYGSTVNADPQSLNNNVNTPVSIQLSQLIVNTLYHYRVKVVSCGTTIYGADKTFTTLASMLPILTTAEINSLTISTGWSGGTISSQGYGEISAKGICWNTSSNPTINLATKTNDGNGMAAFTSHLTGLSYNTYYFVRAYATNASGTAYGNQVVFRIELNYGSYQASDADGNWYNSVKIGTQTWLTENLKTTSFNDGTPVAYITDNTAWASLSTPAYCWYENDMATYGSRYGALYNYFVADANRNGGKNICPVGWHVPTNDDWTRLIAFLDGDDNGGSYLKESGITHWQDPNTGANNATGFTALPGGLRGVNGPYFYIGTSGSWWSSTPYDSESSWFCDLYYLGTAIGHTMTHSTYGFSVRCIMDQ